MRLCRLVASWCRNFEMKDCLGIAMLVLFSMFASMVPVEAQSIGNVWYVSPNASAALPSDGRSWNSAWRSLSTINWNSVLPGDTIFLDGGYSGIVYSSSLKVQKSGTASRRIFIKQSTEFGHYGTVYIRGQSVGIEIPNRAYISVIGSRWRGIIIDNCSFAGVKVSGTGATAVSNLLQNIEVTKCGGANTAGSGIDFSGDQLALNQVIAHDNSQSNLNAHLPNQNYAVGAVNLTRCWIYNSNNLNKSDGVVLDGASTARPKMYLNDCILGPGLGNGTKIGVQTSMTADGVLFINGSRSNVLATSNSSTGPSVVLRNTTSFLTRLNAQGQAHSFMDAPGQLVLTTINRSVVFGGSVLLRPGRVGTGNFQFRTTGNTAAISDRMVNPQFYTSVGDFPNNVSSTNLINADFGIPYMSPAYGKGARITSVLQLLGN